MISLWKENKMNKIDDSQNNKNNNEIKSENDPKNNEKTPPPEPQKTQAAKAHEFAEKPSNEIIKIEKDINK